MRRCLLFIQLSGSKEADSSSLPKSKNPDIQGLRDKLVLDLEPYFRYLDNEKKECIRVVTPMVMLLEAASLDDAGIG